MQSTTALDALAEPMTLAAADTGLASPLAEVAAQAPAIVVADVPAAAPMAVAPLATITPAATPLGTLAPSVPATLPMLGALLLVVGLILVLGKLVKKLQSRTTQANTLQVKGGVQIGGKERVVWMQAGDTHLLLGVSPGRVQTLHVFDVPPDFAAPAANETAAPIPAPGVAANTPASRDFSDRLKTLLAHAKAKGLDIETAAAESGHPVEAVRPVAAKPAEAPRAATSKPQFSFRA